MKKKKFRITEGTDLAGIPVSPGIISGHAVILSGDFIQTREEKITESQVSDETSRFKNALQDTITDLQLVMDQVGSRLDAHQRDIFDAHMMILEDRHIIDETMDKISKDYINADHAYFTIMQRYQQSLDESGDSYWQERATEIRDIKRRVIRKMHGYRRKEIQRLKGAVIIARELTVFDIKNLANSDVAGVILERGGLTSHIAIMIRSMELPAVFGAKGILGVIQKDDEIIANGLTGKIFINPSPSIRKQSERIRKNFLKFKKDYLRVAEQASVTKDGTNFTVNANLTFPEELDAVAGKKKFGIGLYRTEHDFIEAVSIPTEEALFKRYRETVKKVNPYPVSIRTIDIGGDKPAPFFEIEKELNPFLGWRAIRICLDMPDVFKKQIRAILRASMWGNVKLMIPMISTVGEIIRAKQLIEEAKQELLDQNIQFDSTIPVGIMIEVPSAAICADQLAKEVDFFSIGTNDLIQYSLAVDRTNSRIAQYYNCFDPSVIRFIDITVKAGKKTGIPVALCGEMAGDTLAVPLLLGLGITEFSVSPVILLRIKQILRSLTVEESKSISRKCLRLRTAAEVENYLRNTLESIFPKMDEDDFFHRS